MLWKFVTFSKDTIILLAPAIPNREREQHLLFRSTAFVWRRENKWLWCDYLIFQGLFCSHSISNLFWCKLYWHDLSLLSESNGSRLYGFGWYKTFSFDIKATQDRNYKNSSRAGVNLFRPTESIRALVTISSLPSFLFSRGSSEKFWKRKKFYFDSFDWLECC